MGKTGLYPCIMTTGLVAQMVDTRLMEEVTCRFGVEMVPMVAAAITAIVMESHGIGHLTSFTE